MGKPVGRGLRAKFFMHMTIRLVGSFCSFVVFAAGSIECVVARMQTTIELTPQLPALQVKKQAVGIEALNSARREQGDLSSV